MFGYTSDLRPYRARIADAWPDGQDLRDPDGMIVEDFDTVDNLMMAAGPTSVHGSARDAATAAARWWAARIQRDDGLVEVEATRRLVRTRLAL